MKFTITFENDGGWAFASVEFEGANWHEAATFARASHPIGRSGKFSIKEAA